MLKQLKHRHIVKFYDAHKKGDGFYIFLEYVSQVRKVINKCLLNP
jgi:hypothetical protein